MRKLVFIAAISLLSADSPAIAAGQTTAMSCPSGYAMHIDPVPPPTDDPAQTQTPKTAQQKQQEAQQASTDEMARLHCVPMTNGVPQQ